MMKSAVDGLSDIRGRIGASSKVLESAKSGHEDYLTYATNLVSTLEDVDVAEATTRLAQDEVQLQASSLSLSRLSEIGRASDRDRVCRYVSISVGAVSFIQKYLTPLSH